VGTKGTFLAVGRTTRGEYLTTADYALGLGDNRDSWSTGIGGSEEEAIQHASGVVDQMRRDGAASAIRRVRVRHWRDGSSLADAPVLYQASYYDGEQGLTDGEAYAARVHDWHESVDRFNRNHAARTSPWRMGYSTWSDDWGRKSASCPACAATLVHGP
jgi:hypothetical protein